MGSLRRKPTHDSGASGAPDKSAELNRRVAWRYLRPRDACPAEDRRRHARLPPRCVRDPAAGAVLGGSGHERLLQLVHVDTVAIHAGELGLQVHAFLGQVEPVQCAGGLEALLDGGQSALDRLLGSLAASSGPMPLAAFE